MKRWATKVEGAMYICLGLIERLSEDGVLQTFRIAPRGGDGSVVVDWLRNIEPSHRPPGSADLGPFRIYDFQECVLQVIESRPRTVRFQNDTVEFSFEHHSLPIPNGPAYYSLSLPPAYSFRDLDIDLHGCRDSNKVVILDTAHNIMSIAFEFWHPQRRGSVAVRGEGVHVGTLSRSSATGLHGYYFSDYEKETLQFIDIMYRKSASEIRNLLTQDATMSANKLHRILAVLCNPRQTDSLRLQEEERAIRQAIQLSPHRDSFSLCTLPASTVDDFSRSLLCEEFNIVHFSGHGTEEGILFEDDQGRPFRPPPDALARILGDYSPPIRCVLLNACLSSDEAELISQRVPVVIGMAAPISDGGAVEFSRGFYDALGAGKDEDVAYQEGVRRMHLKNFSDFVNPQLFKGGRA
jgi:hypothetical protein